MQGSQKETQAIVVQESRGTLATPTSIDPLVIIEQRNELLGRLLNYAIRATHAGQWVDQQGKPYPTAAAAEVMARRCAVTIKDVNVNKTPSNDDEGQFYLYVVTCTASLPGEFDSIQAIGTCSSRDQFLGTKTSQGRPLSEVDEGNIMKAAYSNMIVNAVTRLLGVRNMTWEQLEKLGIAKDGAAHVDYQKGSRGGGGGRSATSDPEIKWGKSKGQRVSDLDAKQAAFYLEKAEESVAKNDEKWHKQNVAMRDALKAHLEKLTGGKNGEAAPGEKKDSKRQHAIWKAIGELNLDPKGFVERTLGSAKRWQDWTDDDMGNLESSIEAERAMVSEPGSAGQYTPKKAEETT